MPFDPIHRIDPQFLSMPAFGQDLPFTMPEVDSRVPHYRTPQGSAMGMLAPLLAMGLSFPGEAGAPEMPWVPKAPEEPLLDVMPDSLAFGPAFKKARKMGLQIFEWRGKKYTTELK